MDPAKMKVVDLRSELGALGLDTKGNKPALVERLRKALESKTGEAIGETTILDTSTEDADDSPKTPGPASRTTRRSSSTTKLVIPMSKVLTKSMEESDTISEESNTKPTTVDLDDDSSSQDCVETTQQSSGQESPEERRDMQQDEESKESESQMETDPDASKDADSGVDNKDSQSQDVVEVKKEETRPEPELTEEEELEQLAEKLKVEYQQRKEDSKKYIEARDKQLEGLKDQPIKYARVQRKRSKQARWQTLYQHVNGAFNINSEPLPESFALNKPTPLMNLNINKPRGGDPATAKKTVEEPEQDEFKIALSYYDCDLNQHIELPDLNSVLPNSEGTFAHAWAGTRATHGVTSGRVCYEVRVGSVVGTTEENVTNGLRIGWSTTDASLHLGEDKLGWGYESNGELVNNGEYKEYGKSFQEGDVVGVYLDLKSHPCKISYTVNGVEQGTAFEIDPSLLKNQPVFPHILTKNYCYRINFGYDRYNMLTKTKSVRSKLAIPVSQLKEARKAREAVLIKQREEARERIEKIRKEREERQRKKREEREKQDRERKEREAAKKKAAAESATDGEKPDDKEKQTDDKEKQTDDKEKQTDDKEKQTDDKEKQMADKEKQPDDKEKQPEDKDMEVVEVKDEGEAKRESGEPKENGEKLSTSAEPMETDNEGIKSEPKPVEKNAEEEESKDPMTTLKISEKVKDFAKDAMDEVLDGQEACLLPGYILIAHADLHLGPQRPKTLAECEVILMVGLPGSGKSYWVQQHIAENPEKKYNILCTASLLNQMQVKCKPYRSTYEGNWENLLTKCSKYVLKLFAQGRKRNFILDQTNVYQSAQKRKLREFEGYKRIAVVVVPDKETYEERLKKRRESAEGKDLTDDAIVDMKANFSLPEKGQHLEEVIYAALAEEEAKKMVEEFQKEGRAQLGTKDREKRDRSPHRDGPPSKRSRNEERRGGSFREERRPPRDFGSRDRSSGGESDFMDYRRGGGGGGAGGGGRWGPQRGGPGGPGGRDSGRWGAPPSRFDQPPRDRWSRGGNDSFGGAGGGGGGGGRDFNRDGGFRGGRGGMGGRGGPGPVGGAGPAGMGGFGGPQGFDRASRSLDKRPGAGMGDKRPPNQGNMGGGMGGMGGGGGGGGGGAGSWQRGSQMSQQPAAPGTQRSGGQRPGQNTALARNNQNKGDNQSGQSNQNQNPQNAAGWNQWGNWGNWNNWNQTPAAGWGGWNWGNWGGNQPGGQQQGGNANNAPGNAVATNASGNTGGNKNAAANAGGNAAQNAGDQSQWAAWYQWQQWQQQQQQWSGMQGGNQTGNTQEQQQLWAQYYQNYGAANAGAAAGAQSSDKK